MNAPPVQVGFGRRVVPPVDGFYEIGGARQDGNVNSELSMALSKRVDRENYQGEKRLFNVPEAAKYLGMTEWGIRGLISDGKIPSVRNGRRVFLDIEDMNRWIEESKETADQF